MKNVKQIPLPILETDIDKIKFLYTNGKNSLFKQRYDKSPEWRSFDIIKEYSIHDSRAFNSLTPKMKECAESLFKMLDNHVDDDGNIQEGIEKCILSVCEKHKIEKEKLLDYIELEVREQLKQTIEV